MRDSSDQIALPLVNYLVARVRSQEAPVFVALDGRSGSGKSTLAAALVQEPGVVTVELDTLHRFDHGWDAEVSLRLRDGDSSAVDTYDRHGRIHGHADQIAAIDAVADSAFEGMFEGRDVLVMAPTSTVVDEIDTTITNRLLSARLLDPLDKIEIAGHTFYPGQPVVTRAKDRRLTYGADRAEWVRTGDRWTVVAGTRDEIYLTNRQNGLRQALPADYIADGNVTIDYASTINRAQGATADEAHLLLGERTDAKQLYVGVTRGRTANHVHAAPPPFDLEDYSLDRSLPAWSSSDAVVSSLNRDTDQKTALGRRRQLRDLVAEDRSRGPIEVASDPADRLYNSEPSRNGQGHSR